MAKSGNAQQWHDDPLIILRERFANGEIALEDFKVLDQLVAQVIIQMLRVEVRLGIEPLIIRPPMREDGIKPGQARPGKSSSVQTQSILRLFRHFNPASRACMQMCGRACGRILYGSHSVKTMRSGFVT